MLRFKKPDGSEYPEKSSFVFTDGFSILKNNTYSRDCLNYEDGPAKNIHYGDVLIKYGFSKDINDNDVPFVNENVAIKGTSLKDGDIVIADTAEDTTAGKATEVRGVGNTCVLAGLHTIPCRPNDVYAPNYLGYYINSYAYRKQLLPLMQGTKVTSINRKNIEESVVEVHCLEEQQKIADCLSAVDAVIADYEAQVENMQSQKKGVMQKLFSQEVRFKADDGSEYPEWEYAEIGRKCTLNPKTKGIKDQFIYIDLSSVDHGVINYCEPINKDGAPSRAQRIANKGDVFFQSVRPYNMGHFLYDGSRTEQVVASTGFIQIREKEADNRYIYQILYWEPFMKMIMDRCTGTGYPAINIDGFSTIEIGFPCLEEQQKIADCLSAFDDAIEDLQKTVEHWKNIKKGLLQQLFM